MAHDPQLSLQKAVYGALQGLSLGEDGVPVYEFAPTTAQPPYVLLTQQTVSPRAILAGCRSWECTWLLDVVTSFTSKNQVSSLPATRLAEEILQCLEGQRLPLGEEFQMAPVELVTTTMLTDNPTQETVDVHRYLRFRCQVEQHQPI